MFVVRLVGYRSGSAQEARNAKGFMCTCPPACGSRSRADRWLLFGWPALAPASQDDVDAVRVTAFALDHHRCRLTT